MAEKPKDGLLLYHYTSIRGLLGILETGQILMSDPRFLNDSREWHHAGLIVAATVRAVAEKFWPQWQEKRCNRDQFESMVANMVRRFSNLHIRSGWNSKNTQASPFIFSMSSSADSLSQWRAYGGGDYCIVFDGEALAKFTGASLLQVRYFKEAPDPEIEDVVASFFTSQQRNIHQNGGIDTEVRESGADDFEGLLKDRDYFVRVKHDGFQQEEEWRLIKYIWPGGKDKLFMEARGRYPIPRAIVSIADWPKTARSVIKEVMCGPGVDKDFVRHSLDIIANEWGFHPIVVASELPFRQP